MNAAKEAVVGRPPYGAWDGLAAAPQLHLIEAFTAEADVSSTETRSSLLLKLYNGLMAVLAWVLRKPRVEMYRINGVFVSVLNTRSDIATKVVLERFTEALHLIAKYQPIRFAHLQRDVQLFVIQREAHRGHFEHRNRIVMTELTFLARRDINAAVVASSILHEGVHARIFAFAPGVAATQLGREERICRKAELRFGRALPPELGAPVIARASQLLALDDEDLWVASNPAARQEAIRRADREAAEGAS